LNRKFAVLKKKDFYFAGVSPYHVEAELKKLVLRGVIKWNPQLGISISACLSAHVINLWKASKSQSAILECILNGLEIGLFKNRRK